MKNKWNFLPDSKPGFSGDCMFVATDMGDVFAGVVSWTEQAEDEDGNEVDVVRFFFPAQYEYNDDVEIFGVIAWMKQTLPPHPFKTEADDENG